MFDDKMLNSILSTYLVDMIMIINKHKAHGIFQRLKCQEELISAARTYWRNDLCKIFISESEDPYLQYATTVACLKMAVQLAQFNVNEEKADILNDTLLNAVLTHPWCSQEDIEKMQHEDALYLLFD